MDFRTVYFQKKESFRLSKVTLPKQLENLDDFARTFDQIYNSALIEAQRFVHRLNASEETGDAAAINEQIRLASYPFPVFQTGSRDHEHSSNIHGMKEDLFSAMISPECLLLRHLAQGNDIEATKSRKRLTELYHAFPDVLKRVLVRLGLDLARSTMVTLPLHRAIRLNDVQTLKLLLRRGASSHSIDYRGRTALLVAVENNALQMLDVLVSSSTGFSNLNQPDVFGRSPLNLGVQAGNTELVRRLLASGAKEQMRDMDWRSLHVLAAESGNVALVRILLLAYGDLSMATDSVRSAGLIAAASSGHQEIVRLFVTANADLDGTAGGEVGALGMAVKAGHNEIVSFLLSVDTKVDARRSHVMAPIHYAVERGDREIFDMLLKAGADINASFDCDVENNLGGHNSRMTTTLELASEIGNFYALRQLLNLPELIINRRLRAYERSPLELAAKKGHRSAVELLLSHGAKVDTCYRRHSSTTPLLEAISGGHLSITRALIVADADVNALYSKDERLYRTTLRSSASAGPAASPKAMIRTDADFDDTNMSCIEEEGHPETAKDTALQLAAKQGDVDIVQILLKAGADVSAPRQHYGGTALEYTAFKGHPEIVEILLGVGAAVDAECGEMTALQGAAKGGHHRVVELLLSRKAKVDATSPNSRRQTPLQLAAKGGHLRTVQLLLDWHADIHCQFPDGFATPLQAAAYRGSLEIVRLLLRAGAPVDASPGRCPGYEELTALQAAARREHVGIVRILLSAKANPNASPGNNGFTALGCAAINGNLDIVKILLIAGARVDSLYTSGPSTYTALQEASRRGHIDAARFLLQHNANPNAPALGDFGVTPLQGAVKSGNLELASLLLEAKADVNGQPSSHGMPALSYALSQRHQSIAKLLIDAGADVNATSMYHPHTTALGLAIRNDETELVYRLLEANAVISTDPGSLGIMRHYASPMESAVSYGSVNVFRQLLDAGTDSKIIGYSLYIAASMNRLKMVEILLAVGADPNAQGRKGNRALNAAASEGHLEIICSLLGGGADINTPDRNGKTALYEAAENGHLKVVCVLLGAGADPNTNNMYGRLALCKAVQLGHVHIVRSLLLAGANLNDEHRHVCGGDRTDLHWAAAFGRSEIVRLLLFAGADRYSTTECLYTGKKQNAMDLALRSGNSETVQALRDADQQKSLWPSLKRKRTEAED